MLVLVEGGMLEELDLLTTAWVGKRFAGLMQNFGEPDRNWTIATIQPATFSGYAGLQLISGWTPATLLGERAITSAAGLSWTHNGGPVSNWIFGYYVVNLAGDLLWAERRPGAGQAMVLNGNIFQVLPQFSLGSRFPS